MHEYRHKPRCRLATIHTVYLADGLVNDCEELIQRCCNAGTLNFNVFCNIWKDMDFAAIFLGRPSAAEVAELSEEAIFVAKRFLVQNTSNFEETVASLFLVYSLLHLQPYTRFASLRLTPDDLEAVFRIEDVARQQKRQDVLYILGSILIEGPCQFQAADREYGMDAGVRKYYESTLTTIDLFGHRSKGVFHRQNEEFDLLRELSSLGRRYAKAKVFDNSGQPHRTLRYTDEYMPNQLAAALKQLIDGDATNANGPKSHLEVVQSIKDKAMRGTVKGMRHLQQAPQTQEPLSPESQDISDFMDAMEQHKLKLTPTKSKKKLKKRKMSTNSPKKVSKSRSIVSSDSNSSADDISLHLDSSEDQMSTDDEPEITEEGLKTIDQYFDNLKRQEADKTLPVTLAATENSDEIEIEIIDMKNYKGQDDVLSSVITKKTVKKCNKNVKNKGKKSAQDTKKAANKKVLDKSSTGLKTRSQTKKTSRLASKIVYVDDEKKGEDQQSDDGTNSQGEREIPVLKIPARKIRRKLKRVHLRSKLTRLGIAGIAGFEENLDG